MTLDCSAPETVADPAEDRAGLRLRKLRELSDIGMELARALGRRAVDATDAQGGADLALAFSRVSRAVRQTVALEERLETGFQARADAMNAARAERLAEEAKAAGLRSARGNIHKVVAYDAVCDAIEADARETGREDQVERLFDDLYERMSDAPDTDFADRSIGEVIASICRDLGVTPDWSLWDEEWAEEADEAGLLDAAPAAPRSRAVDPNPAPEPVAADERRPP